MPQWAIGYKSNSQLLGRINKPICLVDSLESRILCLDGVDLGNWSDGQMWLVLYHGYILELALRRVAAEHSDKPIYLVLPALRISSRAGIDSSNGVSDGL